MGPVGWWYRLQIVSGKTGRAAGVARPTSIAAREPETQKVGGGLARQVSRKTLLQWVPLLVLFVLVIFFTALNPAIFSLRNFARIAITSSPALMVAVGVTFIIMGSIDLSMEGAVSLGAVVFAFSFRYFGGSIGNWGWLALPMIVVFGAAFGLINGLIHVRLRIPSFMASLAMGFVGTGAAILLTGGNIVKVDDELFRGLLTVRYLGSPIMVYVAMVFLLVGAFVQSYTTLGRNFYAVGGGEDLAHASGVNVGRVRVMGFALAGAYYAIAAILAVGKIGQAGSVSGANFMFVSITSVVIGLPDYVQDGMLGVLVIVAVVLSTDRRAITIMK